MLIVCDSCGQEIDHTIYETEYELYTRLYLKCSHCGAEYDIMFKCPTMQRLIDSPDAYNRQVRIDKLNNENMQHYYEVIKC